MTKARNQGRPPHGKSSVGRDRLIEKTRDAMKMKPKIDMQRREIARFVGVSPALISYYFPDKWRLFEAAAQPVIDNYVMEVRTVLRSDDSYNTKIYNLTKVFVMFNTDAGYLLDFYLQNLEAEKLDEQLKEITEMYKEIIVFFATLIEEGFIRAHDPAFVQSSLWALCKYVPQRPHDAGAASSADPQAVLQSQVAAICSLFLDGVSMQRRM